MNGTVIYYTYGDKPQAQTAYCRGILERSAAECGLRVVTGWRLPDEPKCHMTLYTQIRRGLICAEGITFLAEDDVLYPPAHFKAGLSHIPLHGPGVYYNTNVIHLSPQGYFKADHPTFLSACCGDDMSLKNAITGKWEETRRSLTHAPVWAEPMADGEFVSAEPIVDVRNHRNFTGMRESAWAASEHPYWGPAERHRILFTEGG